MFRLHKLDSLEGVAADEVRIAFGGFRYGNSVRHRSALVVNQSAQFLIATSIFVVSVIWVVGTRRYGHTWKNCGRVTFSTVVLLMCSLLFVHVGRSLPGLRFSGIPTREVRSSANSAQVETAIDTWADENGYEVSAEQSWRIVRGESDRIGKVRMLELRCPTRFERYQTAGRFVVRTRPAMQVRCLSVEDPGESYVSVDLPMINNGSREETIWPALVDDLAAAIEDPKKLTIAPSDRSINHPNDTPGSCQNSTV